MFQAKNFTPHFISEAKKAKFQGNYFIQILIFIAVFIVTIMASSSVASIFMLPEFFSSLAALDSTSPSYINDIMEASANFQNNPFFVIISLFVTAITTALVIIYCKFIEKRSLNSMGFYKQKALPHYLIGIAIGFIMYSVAVAINYLAGAVTFNGMVMEGGIGLILVFALGFFLQGMSEEVVFRGYFMTSLSMKAPIFLAVLTSSVVFGLMHLGNPSFTVLAFVNIALFGIFMSLYMLKTGDIWGVCAIHSTWNFVQGNFYGGEVSGLECSATVFSFTPTESAALINGGAFGFEGGLAVTIVLTIAILITVFTKPAEHTEG